MNDAMGLVLWTWLCLEAQGYQIDDNIVYQDNETGEKWTILKYKKYSPHRYSILLHYGSGHQETDLN